MGRRPDPLGGDCSTGPWQRTGAVGKAGPSHPDDTLQTSVGMAKVASHWVIWLSHTTLESCLYSLDHGLEYGMEWNGMVEWKMHCSMYVELPSKSLVVPSHCRGFMSKSGIVNRILYSSMIQQLAYHWVFGYSSLVKPECHTWSKSLTSQDCCYEMSTWTKSQDQNKTLGDSCWNPPVCTGCDGSITDLNKFTI